MNYPERWLLWTNDNNDYLQPVNNTWIYISANDSDLNWCPARINTQPYIYNESHVFLIAALPFR